MIEKNDFIKLISGVQDYYQKLNKIEAVLDCVLEKYCTLPEIVLEYAEEKTGRKWTDEIFDMVYTNKDAVEIYDEILKLPDLDTWSEEKLWNY